MGTAFDNFEVTLSPTQGAFVNSDAVVNLIYSNKGEGKSLDLTEKVIMADGSLREAQDVKSGDQLMGDDSTVRNVLSVHRDWGDMYEVFPIKGESFKCNKEHILVLNRCSKNKKKFPDTIIEMAVEDYLKQNKTFRGVATRLYRSPIDFPEKDVPIDPYFIGLWLGDGNSRKLTITTEDKEIVAFLYKFAKSWKTKVRISLNAGTNKSKNYNLTNGNTGAKDVLLFKSFKPLNLIQNKHIPDAYKHNSYSVRRKLLAGLIDSDGSFNHEGWDYITKLKRLGDDIVYLARSLGLAAYIKPCKKGIKSRGFIGDYYRIHISGDCSDVPVLLERKKCNPRKQVKNVLVTGIKEIKSLGRGEYAGFILDGNHRFLLGSFIVSHNTVGAIMALIRHAERCKKDIRGAIVRDTHENIKTSTARSIMDFLPRGLYRFKNDFKHLTIYSHPRVEMDLFGVDNTSISKLMGPEYAIIWLEEPAPIIDATNAGLSEDVFNASLASCVRQTGTVPRLLLSMNPADTEHWTYRRFFTDTILGSKGEVILDPDNPLITLKVFRIPPGENPKLSDFARQGTKVAYKHDAAGAKRFVSGEFAEMYKGEKVVPDYNPDLHLSRARLIPARGLIGFRFWDSWSNPAVVIGQITRLGRLIFLDTCRSTNSDVRVLIKTQVQPLMNTPKWKDVCRGWRDGGDFSMRQPDQSNKQESAARVVEDSFGTIFESGPQRWEFMRRGMISGLSMNIKGMPAIIINKENKMLHSALAGGWHYKTDNAGNRTSDIPVKADVHSHTGDAFANAVNVLLPNVGNKMDKKKWNEINKRTRARASSYAVG